jgi:hypothetical protein
MCGIYETCASEECDKGVTFTKHMRVRSVA